MHSAGYPVWMAGLCSVLIYAGSMQYAAVSLLGTFDPLGTFVLTLMINARHLFYGLSLLEPYAKAGKKKLYMAFALTDETFSVNVSAQPPADVDKGWFMFWVSLLDQSYWVLASVLGAVAGSVLTINTRGIDFVMTALFVTIFTGQWLDASDHRPALVGLGCAVLCRVVFGAEFIISAMVLIVAFLLAMRKTLEQDTQSAQMADGEEEQA
jgi:4-azaleucine resistance transporter AzlC